MNILNVSDVGITATPHKVDVRKLYDKVTAQANHITLQPGEALKPHITPVDVFFYILEGTPDIMVGNETVQVTNDSLVESPRNIIHCIYNNSQQIARVLVVKTPRPEDKFKVL